MTWAFTFLYVVTGYLGVGVLVGLAFLGFALPRVDAAGKGSSIAFRILVFPGCVLLWPALIGRWRRG